VRPDPPRRLVIPDRSDFDALRRRPGGLQPGADVNGKDTSTERSLPRRNILRASEQTPE
jgi:hypothetical protein